MVRGTIHCSHGLVEQAIFVGNVWILHRAIPRACVEALGKRSSGRLLFFKDRKGKSDGLGFLALPPRKVAVFPSCSRRINLCFSLTRNLVIPKQPAEQCS